MERNDIWLRKETSWRIIYSFDQVPINLNAKTEPGTFTLDPSTIFVCSRTQIHLTQRRQSFCSRFAKVSIKDGLVQKPKWPWYICDSYLNNLDSNQEIRLQLEVAVLLGKWNQSTDKRLMGNSQRQWLNKNCVGNKEILEGEKGKLKTQSVVKTSRPQD
jgi:hypothetical protein